MFTKYVGAIVVNLDRKVLMLRDRKFDRWELPMATVKFGSGPVPAYMAEKMVEDRTGWRVAVISNPFRFTSPLTTVYFSIPVSREHEVDVKWVPGHEVNKTLALIYDTSPTLYSRQQAAWDRFNDLYTEYIQKSTWENMYSSIAAKIENQKLS